MQNTVFHFRRGKSIICFALVIVLLLLAALGCAPTQARAGELTAAEPLPAAPEAEPSPAPAEQTPAVSGEGPEEVPMFFPFREVRWGMTPAEVAAMEGREPDTSERGVESGLYLEIYDPVDVLGIPMYFSYTFDENGGLNYVRLDNAWIPDMDEADYEAAFDLLCEYISETYGSYVHRSSEPDGSRRYLFSEKEATLELMFVGEPEEEYSGRISIEYFPASGFAPISLERYSLCPFAPITWGVPLEYVTLAMGREPEWHNVLDNGYAHSAYYYTLEIQGYELCVCYGFDEKDRLSYASVTYGEYSEYSRTQFEECNRWFHDVLVSTYGEPFKEGYNAQLQMQEEYFSGDSEVCWLVLLDEGREDGLEFTGAYFYPFEDILEPLPYPILGAFHGMSPEDMIALEGREPDEQTDSPVLGPEGMEYYYEVPVADGVRCMSAYRFDERNRLMEAILAFRGDENSPEDIQATLDEIYFELCQFYGEPFFPPVPEESADTLVAMFTGSGFMVQLVCKKESPNVVNVYFLPLNEFEYVSSE